MSAVTPDVRTTTRGELVPHPRLLWATALLVVPATGLLVAIPSLAPWMVAVIGLVIGLAVVDAWRGARRLRALRIAMPEVQRLTKDRPGRIELHLEGGLEGTPQLRLGLPWPASLAESPEELPFHLPSGASRARLEWPCIAGRRGRFELGLCSAEINSPWGLWQNRRRLPLPGEIRVYPNLLKERRHVAALFLPRAAGGIRPQRQLGQGREFEKLRDYVAGDAWDDIHWKASAKRGRPVTRLFQVERTQEIYVVLDTSRLAARPMAARDESVEADHSQLESLLVAALVLGLAAQRQGDLFGLVAFSDRLRVFLRAAGGREHFVRCREALHTVQAEDVSPDFGELFSALRTRLRRRALLVILTALDDPLLAEEFIKGVQLVARQHLVLVSQVAPLDARPVLTGQPPRTPEDICLQLAGHTRWQMLRGLEGRLRRLGVTLTLLPAGQLSAKLVSQYMTVKRRQAL